MKSYILSLALILMLIPSALAQKPRGHYGVTDTGWSDAETAYARMQEAFLSCISNYIVKVGEGDISSMQNGNETFATRKGKGHFSAHVTEYKDNGKDSTIEMEFYDGKQYNYEYIERTYENELTNNNSWDFFMTITGEDGIQIKYSSSSSKKDNKECRNIEVISSTKFSR